MAASPRYVQIHELLEDLVFRLGPLLLAGLLGLLLGLRLPLGTAFIIG